MATGPAGKGRPASNAGQRRGADDNVGHELQAATLLDAGLISRYRMPAAGNPADRSLAVPLLDLDSRGPGDGHPCTASANRRVNQTQLLSVLVDVNDIETSNAPGIRPRAGTSAARVRRRWPPWCSAALRWSSWGDSPCGRCW
jgi:hypothetical protein